MSTDISNPDTKFMVELVQTLSKKPEARRFFKVLGNQTTSIFDAWCQQAGDLRTEYSSVQLASQECLEQMQSIEKQWIEESTPEITIDNIETTVRVLNRIERFEKSDTSEHYDNSPQWKVGWYSDLLVPRMTTDQRKKLTAVLLLLDSQRVDKRISRGDSS